MGRDVFRVGLGLEIAGLNEDSGVQILFGPNAPGGETQSDAAPVGSLFIRQAGNGSTIYQKIASANSTSDWLENGSSSATIGVWRPETVRAVTSETLAPGVRDLAASPFTDDEAPLLTAADFAVGEFVIGGSATAPLLLEVTNVSAPNITLATPASAQPIGPDHTWIVANYLPDSPGGQEGQAIVVATSNSVVKVADVDFAIATGINVSSGYSASAADPGPGDTVEQVLQALDGNNDAQDSLIGRPQGSTDLGTFSGNVIPDGTSVVGALQSLETSQEEIDQNVDDLITLSGSPENAVDHGTFTGSTIADGQTTKGALQDLETAHESLATDVAEIDQNVDDLITLSGQPENSVDFGAFTGSLLPDNSTSKALFQRIEDLLEELKVIEVTGVTAQTVIDAVPVASVSTCKWIVEAFEEATPANKKSSIVLGLNNGSQADDTRFAKLRVGANFDLSISVDVSGGQMRLLAQSSTAGVTVRVRRIQVTDV